MAAPAAVPALTAIMGKAWPYLLALFGADLAAKGVGQWRGIGLQSKQMDLLQKQMEQGPELGRMEAERYDKLVKQLMGLRKEETKERRETELMRTLESGRTRQTGMIMAMMQALTANAPTGFRTRGGPPASLVGLLR